MPMHARRRNLPLDDLHPPTAADMIDDTGEESNEYAETGHSNPRSYPTTVTGPQKFEWKLYKRIIRQQQ